MADADLSNSGSDPESENSGIESPDPDSRSVSPVENVDISSGSEKQAGPKSGPGPALKVSKKGTAGGSTTDNKPPTTAQMVNTALAELNDKKGSSLSAIKKCIAEHYNLEVTKQLATRICKNLNSGVDKGLVLRTKGAGANGSFKLAEHKDPKPKPKSPKTEAVVNKSKPKPKREVTYKEKKASSAAVVAESSTKENNIKTSKPAKKQLPPPKPSAAAVSSSKITEAKPRPPTTTTANKSPAKPLKSPAQNVATPSPNRKSPKGKAEKRKSPKVVVKPKSPKAKVLLAKMKSPKAVGAKPKSPKNPVKAKPSKAPKTK